MVRTRSNAQQAYGYLVCLIAIIVGLISLHSLIDAVFERSRPDTSPRYAMYGGNGAGAQGVSFEEFKAAFGRSGGDSKSARDSLPPDSTLHRIYNEKRLNARAESAWQAEKDLVKSSLVLLVTIALFSFHWRWLRRESVETLAVYGTE